MTLVPCFPFPEKWQPFVAQRHALKPETKGNETRRNKTKGKIKKKKIVTCFYKVICTLLFEGASKCTEVICLLRLLFDFDPI